MLVSVLISNHNYERYLGSAIDSALDQTHSAVEVIVVDDGSTDGSRQVIARYGDEILGLTKEQGGQASALNLAFAHSRGELVCLLDADDVFAREKVAEVLAAARRRPNACLIHHQMQIIDAAGMPMHSPFPVSVVDGDIRDRVTRTAGWYDRAPTSALSFRRPYLERLFPIPTDRMVADLRWGPEEVELKADTYLAAPAAFVGPVSGIELPLTRYRLHSANKSRIGATAVAANRRRAGQYVVEFEAMRDALRERFGEIPDLALDDHLEYQMCRAALGEVSRLRLVRQILRSPTLPGAMRAREALRAALNKGPSRRS